MNDSDEEIEHPVISNQVNSQDSNVETISGSQESTEELNVPLKKTKRCKVKPRPTWKHKPRKKKTAQTLYNVASATFGTTTPDQSTSMSVNNEDCGSANADIAEVTPTSRRQQKRNKRMASLTELEVNNV